MKKYLFMLLAGFCFCSLYAQMEFKSFDLNNNNKLLFSVEHTPVVDTQYESLFYYSLDEPYAQNIINDETSNPRLLTCFPERVDVIKGGREIFFRNRYGSAKYNMETRRLEWGSKPNETASNAERFLPLNHERLAPVSVSPDGRYVSYIEQTSPARGKLIIKSLSVGKTFVLAENCPYGFDSVPIIWSQNSNVAIYENNGFLYFLNLKEESFSKQLPEKYRKIGNGTINNVYWASDRKLIYVQHDLVYEISPDELYTRALYSDLIGTGKIIGRLPSPFNGSVDRFWTSDTGLSFIFLQDNRTLVYMELTGTDFNFATTLFSYPFVTVPGTALNFMVFWAYSRKVGGRQIPFVWLEMLRDGQSESYVYSLEKGKDGNYAFFNSLPVPVFSKLPKVSPDKKSIAFICGKAFYVYEISSWTQKYVFNDEEIVYYSWLDSSSLILGGKQTVRNWRCAAGASEILFLSQAKKYGWSGESNDILAQNDFGTFSFDSKDSVWKRSDNNNFRDNSAKNGKWRIFLDKSQNSAFKNSLFCRELKSESHNKALFEFTVRKESHDKPMVALTIDCLDNADGLTPILASLNRYGVNATFFINGEFIRRFPSALNEIIKGGHQCGSMFYSPFAVSSEGFDVNENYIRRGLARNEDDFFEVTGQELSLVWHMPNYYSNNAIQKAGSESGYVWIDKGLAPQDKVTYQDALKKINNYKSSSQMIDEIIERISPGQIIPISCGVSNGTRGDYLYNNLDVLISAILSKGYRIVTATELLQSR